MGKMNFHSIRLLVNDFAACFRFYRDTLGLEVVWGEESGPYADFKAASDSYISLFNRHLMSEVLGTGSMSEGAAAQDSLAIIIQVEDLQKTVSKLKQQGVTFVSDVKEYPAWTISAAHLRDPEGNLIELFSPLDKSRWTEETRDLDDRTSRE